MAMAAGQAIGAQGSLSSLGGFALPKTKAPAFTGKRNAKRVTAAKQKRAAIKRANKRKNPKAASRINSRHSMSAYA